MTTLRIPDELLFQIEILMKMEHKTKTEIIKAALTEYMQKYFSEKSAYELGKDLFGKHSSEQSDLSTSYKDILRKKLHEKHTH